MVQVRQKKVPNTAWNLATKMAAGVPYQSSIFFDDLEDGTPIYEQILKKDQKDTVNGQMFEGPGIIVRKWLLTAKHAKKAQGTQRKTSDSHPSMVSCRLWIMLPFLKKRLLIS